MLYNVQTFTRGLWSSHFTVVMKLQILHAIWSSHFTFVPPFFNSGLLLCLITLNDMKNALCLHCYSVLICSAIWTYSILSLSSMKECIKLFTAQYCCSQLTSAILTILCTSAQYCCFLVVVCFYLFCTEGGGCHSILITTRGWGEPPDEWKYKTISCAWLMKHLWTSLLPVEWWWSLWSVNCTNILTLCSLKTSNNQKKNQEPVVASS